MDRDQTNKIPLFIRRTRNAEMLPSFSMKAMERVFTDEEIEGGKSFCPQIMVNDLSSFHVDVGLIASPTKSDKIFGLERINPEHYDTEKMTREYSSGDEIFQGRPDDQNTSGMAMPLSHHQTFQNLQITDHDPTEDVAYPRRTFTKHDSFVSFNSRISKPLTEGEYQSRADLNGRTQTKMYVSPCLPRTAGRHSSTFLNVFQYESFPGLESDSECSSASSTPSSFFDDRFRFSKSRSISSVECSSTSSTPEVSPFGDFKEHASSASRRPKEKKLSSQEIVISIENIENDIHRLNISEEYLPKATEDAHLTPIEIEAKERHERRMRQKRERELKKDERIFF